MESSDICGSLVRTWCNLVQLEAGGSFYKSYCMDLSMTNRIFWSLMPGFNLLLHQTLNFLPTPTPLPNVFPNCLLSLHVGCHVALDASSTAPLHRPFNMLSIAGSFSLGEAHAWIRSCLPDVPDHIPVEDEATLYFKSVFTTTQLECTYR